MNKERIMEGLGGPVRLEEYHLDGIDPSLEDCCRREVESNRRHNALTSTLRRHDVALLAERRRRNVIKTPEFEGCRCCSDPNLDGGSYPALVLYKAEKMKEQHLRDENDNETEKILDNDLRISSKQGDEIVDTERCDTEDDNDDSSSSDEFDYLLDEDLLGEDDKIRELEEARRAELEYQLLMRQVAEQHGYGVVRQMHPNRVLKVAGLGRTAMVPAASGRHPPPAVVLHLVDPDSIVSASLDYYFETELAKANPGTVFLRSEGRSTLLVDPLVLRSLPSSVSDPEKDMPVLVAIRDGVVINACPRLEGFTTYSNRNENGEVDTYAVRQWLDHCGVLLTNLPRMEDVCFICPEEDALMDYLRTQPKQQQGIQEEWYDCGIEGCNKAYKHDHVGIQTSEQRGLVVNEETILGNDA